MFMRLAYPACCLIVGVCAAASSSETLRNLRNSFVGEWHTRELKSNLPEFKGTTDFTFYVYAVEVLDARRPPPDLRANLVAEFVVKGEDGKERLPYLCCPMDLWGTNRLHAGPFMEGMFFRYSFTNSLLVLERHEGESEFFAKLERTKKTTGEPRCLPSWERTRLRGLREQQGE